MLKHGPAGEGTLKRAVAAARDEIISPLWRQQQQRRPRPGRIICLWHRRRWRLFCFWQQTLVSLSAQSSTTRVPPSLLPIWAQSAQSNFWLLSMEGGAFPHSGKLSRSFFTKFHFHLPVQSPRFISFPPDLIHCEKRAAKGKPSRHCCDFIFFLGGSFVAELERGPPPSL